MCRIAGIIHKNHPPTEEQIVLMRDAMQHGGPDDCGIYIDTERQLALGHRRLALIDLSPAGHQPMYSAANDIAIVFNGEIYNYSEIKDELQKKGYRFISSSDTEVIIYAYDCWGIQCFKKFNGMFALCLLDKSKNKLILARDHAGIKPLYYSISHNSLYFASEVKAFKTIEPNWPENKDWKKYFLLFGHLPEPHTTLENVYPLAKGTCMEIDIHTLQYSTTKFFTPYYNYTVHKEEEAIELVRKSLTKAVERHLISDAPIGLFLSGGLDSSLLTLIAQPFLGKNLHTLSIIFDSEKYSEKYYQDIITQQTNANHRSFLVSENDFKESLPDIIAAMDQPSHDGINSYFISKHAKAYGLTAVLSGLGADELFGGYPTFNRTNAVSSVRWLPNFMLSAAGIFPDDKRKKLSFLQQPGIMGEYLFSRGFFIPAQVAQLLDCSIEEVQTALDKMALPMFTEKLLQQEKVSYMETNLYMQNQLLKDTDYMSMWHSLEVRVPFLDKELMELAFNINPDIRFNAQQPKHLLIKAFKDILPKEIWDRPKQGFVFPFELWMQHVKPNPPVSKTFNHLYKGLVNGKIHWSRYWSYLLLNEKQTPNFVAEG